MKKPIICIDPGHGGKDSGAVGPGGLREADVVLSVALMLAARLMPIAEVVLTRKSNVYLTLSERAEISNAAGPELFLSLHCNSAANPARGFEVFTTPGETLADSFASDLFHAYHEEFPELAARLDNRDGDPDKEASFAVLRETDAPAALFELEFIHTEEGSAFLRSAINQGRMAKALEAGIRRHLGEGESRAATEAPGTDLAAADRERIARAADAAFAEVRASIQSIHEKTGELASLVLRAGANTRLLEDRLAALKGDSAA